MTITVKMPGGATMTATIVGKASAMTGLVKFGPMQLPYKFDTHTGVSKDSKLRGWCVVEEDLERFREAVRGL